MAGSNALAKLAQSLLSGGDNFITKIVKEKIEDLGRELIADAVGSILPGADVATRIVQAVATGGESEFGRLRNQWLNAMQPADLPGVSRLAREFDRAYREAERHQEQEERERHTPWRRTDWASSRRDWLDNRWRHDWRSQPRDPETGRWVPGRLKYIAPELQTPGKRVGRTVRRWRAIRRKRRAVARKAARAAIDND